MILSRSEKEVLVQWVINLNNWGFPLRKEDAAYKVKKIASLPNAHHIGDHWVNRLVS